MNEAELQKLLASLYRNLNTLRAREARFSGNAPLDLLNQIKDHETAIELIEARLAGEISDEALEAGLQPLALSLDRGQTEIRLGQTIAVDRSLITIGTLSIPTLPIVALLVIVVSVLGFLGYNFVGSREMPLDTFNIAVAEFGQVDEAGNLTRSEDGRNLSEWLFGQLQSNLKEFGVGEVTIWHDSINFFQKPTKLGMITGQNAAERRAAAKALAERIGANMVVYGNLAVDQNAGDFVPEFYIAALRNEADELVGSQELGEPIPVRLPINFHDEVTDAFFEDQLGLRVDALAYFTRGLAFDLSGRHDQALNVFKEAEAALPGWRDDEGKEILYYFIGREALFVGQEDRAMLDEAETAFTESLRINPDYTRAHIGLGGVYLQRGQYLIIEANASDTALDPLVLEQYDHAIEEYRLAVIERSSIPEAEIEFKAALGLGTAYSAKALAYINLGQEDQADVFADLAIDQLNRAINLLNPTQHRIRAQGYLALGSAYQIKAHIQVRNEDRDAARPLFEEARQAYDLCSQEAEIDFYDTTLREDIKTKCDRNRDDVVAEIEK